MIPEVGLLIASHTELRRGKKGRDPHNSILKSSVMMLCAIWELYCESVLEEAVAKLLEAKSDPQTLPDAIKGQIKQAVYHENVWKSDPLSLAGFGWRDVHLRIVKERCASFNTPKPKQLDDLFKKMLGLKELSKSWTVQPSEIENFVKLRGEIAHRGTDAANVPRDDAIHYKVMISKTISETDDAIYDFLRAEENTGRAPWQKTSK
ncbi:hypothetical protein GTA62_08315 [Roseobacter sp. HKCCD9010]|uniref:HEPN domain-containing protein n=1 Tax=unclassified Roseobacter TaxID=196798 RepID=UPI001491A4D5|nr:MULTISPECIES: HEPN domain-containing protein [unclassified Roseobacter]MBF9051293.1 hypothetical protein [Rhodobacterales bacterium HKCCD4356]NNV13340.1 hypothetical protein [Roseobacter sp. HKCCD7357]NNV17591.1 hypothetical protein [Roseobacter sp. HKCCD8768]NNV27197.1 hypothetical protein [Roseobacter sp. HKCCD8192]NNV31317.1 hypothetical protein [Roseobacter sp. HKCCD9061]